LFVNYKTCNHLEFDNISQLKEEEEEEEEEEFIFHINTNNMQCNYYKLI